METIAVIDTETNWNNEVMSVGVVLADREKLQLQDCRYYLFEPEIWIGGMYDGVLELPDAMPADSCSRETAMQRIRTWLKEAGVRRIFAYNARFDRGHLPELSEFDWYDIMKIAAYRQYNPAIGPEALCCSTGRLKRNYGVEPILRMLSGDRFYCETHNALLDAVDELKIMRLLPLTMEQYPCAALKG